MLIDARNEANQRVVTLLDARLDASSAVDFKDALLNDIEQGHKDIILDLEKVDFIDSSGLGALVSVLKAVSSDGSLVVTGLQKKTEQIFKLTRMDTVFQIYPSVSEALEAV